VRAFYGWYFLTLTCNKSATLLNRKLYESISNYETADTSLCVLKGYYFYYFEERLSMKNEVIKIVITREI
jgi:hypothetical protein